ncbi:MAG: hypothetical protein E7384_00420 [Ruminococcaceae bacterium]|nr:hypothetical protein [Oscillospiraceae bacterium]
MKKKKIVLLFLPLLVILILCACNSDNEPENVIYSAESISVAYRENPEKTIVLSDTDTDIILDMINLQEWEDRDIKARFQYSFSVGDRTILYSDMGVFRDESRNRDLCIPYEQYQLVNSMVKELRPR